MYYTYAVGLKFIAAREGLPHNVLHSSSYTFHHFFMQYYRLTEGYYHNT